LSRLRKREKSQKTGIFTSKRLELIDPWQRWLKKPSIPNQKAPLTRGWHLRIRHV
jgi:hypothetical protein